MAGKVLALGFSVILIVGVFIGVIANVDPQETEIAAANRRALSSTSTAVASVCAQTDHQKECVDSMSSVVNNQSATPLDFLKAAINVAISEIDASMDKPAEVGKSVTDSVQKMAVEDCKELLKYAVAELQASFSMVGDSSLHTIKDREAELKNWLSAVISYQQTCADGFTQPELRDQMNLGLLNATQLTDNALAIVSALSQIFQAFNLDIGSFTSWTSKDGFPSWLRPGDRKLLATGGHPEPNAVVAKDGSGQFKTINDALKAYPKGHQGRYVIYVKEGLYDESVIVEKDQTNVYMYGDGPRKSVVTGSKSNIGGFSTFRTASFAAIGDGFVAKSMGFRNTAGPKGHQAVALRVQSDMSSFHNCRMEGYQDTLYTQAHRQFYRNCVISGTVDFIFGDGAVVIQNCLIIVRKPMDNQKNIVTAQGRTKRREPTGIVIQNCRIVPEQILEPVRFKIPTYLGRPWKEYSRTIIMESTLADFIQPEGYMPWIGNFAIDTLEYAEFANRGPGAPTDKRVKWKGYRVITDKKEALQYTVDQFIQGSQWLKTTGIPHFLGLKNA